jgi:thiol-disulfide isomerase/thioredoxin
MKRFSIDRWSAVLGSAILLLFLSAAPSTQASEALERLDKKADGSRVLNLILHDEPVEIPALQFIDESGEKRDLSDFKGKITALHFWATWCFPCRAELPTMSVLQREMEGEDFVILPLSVDRGGTEIAASYLSHNGITDLAAHVDEKMNMARALRVNGIPYTIFLDREGKEFARVLGDRDWSEPEVFDIIRQMTREM